jgi:tRNA (cmo5U34)-methyltransferase
MTESAMQAPTESRPRDRLFAGDAYPHPFAFDAGVARVFDDMAARSIPLYAEVTQAAVDWTLRHYRDGTAVYDLGCSTGTALAAIGRALAQGNRRARLVGVDTAEPMLAAARSKLAPLAALHDVTLSQRDAADVEIRQASVVIVNYTLQFLPPAQRRTVLERAHAGLVPGGVLLVSDKLASGSERMQETLVELYERFKERQGYSRMEIERKKAALRGVLVPLTFQGEMELLAAAGFRGCEPVLAWNNFVTMVAVKA